MVKKGEDELKCFEEMKLKGVSPDAITFACSLKACACIGALSRGIEIHGEIEKTGLIGRDSIVGNALIGMRNVATSLKPRSCFIVFVSEMSSHGMHSLPDM
mgnify:CR=1 FL=1